MITTPTMTTAPPANIAFLRPNLSVRMAANGAPTMLPLQRLMSANLPRARGRVRLHGIQGEDHGDLGSCLSGLKLVLEVVHGDDASHEGSWMSVISHHSETVCWNVFSFRPTGISRLTIITVCTSTAEGDEDGDYTGDQYCAPFVAREGAYNKASWSSCSKG